MPYNRYLLAFLLLKVAIIRSPQKLSFKRNSYLDFIIRTLVIVPDVPDKLIVEGHYSVRWSDEIVHHDAKSHYSTGFCSHDARNIGNTLECAGFRTHKYITESFSMVPSFPPSANVDMNPSSPP